MSGFFTMLGEWYTEIIAVLVGMFIVWILGLLPEKFQYHKRLNFALKVKKAVSKIEISIETKNKLNINEVKERGLEELFKKHSVDEVTLNSNELSFLSTETGATYKIRSSKIIEDGNENEKNFIIISCSNAFGIGFFGGIKGLKDIVNEIQIMLDCFIDFRKNKDNLTVHITITPRLKFLRDEKMNVYYTGRNFTTSYTIKDIKVVNKGTGYLEENINKVFYTWMTSLL